MNNLLQEQPDPKRLPDIHLKFKELPPLDALVVDIETTSLDPTAGRILAVGLYNGFQTKILRDADEAAILRDFCQRIKCLSGDTILVGHNLMKFDLPFIIERCKVHGISCPFVYRELPYGDRIIKDAYNRYHEIRSQYVQIVDTLHLALLADAQKLFSNHGLKTLAVELDVRKERRLELTPKEIVAYWTSGDPRFEEYLTYDLVDTFGVFNKLYPPFYEQLSFLPNITRQEVVLASTAKKVELLLKDYYKGSSPEASPKIEYEGAYTSVAPGLYHNIQKIDVSSLYPSIMIQYQITTDKDPDLVLPAYLKDILKLRLEYKKTNKDRSDALKLLMNSAYGFLASTRAFNCPSAAAEVTRIGRIILHLMIDKMIELGGTVIECDTDGIYYSSANAIHDEIQVILPKGINIEQDDCGVWGLFYKSKNYCIKKDNGSYNNKGLFRKRDTPKYKTEFMKTCAELTVEGKDADAYYQQMLQDITAGTYPVEKLASTSKIRITEVARLRYGKPGDKVISYTGYDSVGKKDVVVSGPYNTKFYGKALTKQYTELKPLLKMCNQGAGEHPLGGSWLFDEEHLYREEDFHD